MFILNFCAYYTLSNVGPGRKGMVKTNQKNDSFCVFTFFRIKILQTKQNKTINNPTRNVKYVYNS